MQATPLPDVAPIARALTGVPIHFDAPPHVYSVCCPRFEPAPGIRRERLSHERLRLYIHVPFCRYKCSFCNFAIRVGAQRELMERYVEAVRRELEWIDPGTPLSQLFVGGGTPTALPADLLDAVLGAAFARVDASAGKVHTCEASPETISEEHVEVILARGIGRVSLGIQSLESGVLDGIRRGHDAEQALGKLSMLKDNGLVVNADLIYGLPGQSEESFRRDMIAVAEAGANAMTLYDLRIHDGTTVGKALADEERLDLTRLLRWRILVRATAEELGFVQTRWHTFKRRDSVALQHHWMPTFDDTSHGFQLGVGSSARSHLGHAIYRNTRRPEPYIERVLRGESPVDEVFRLTEADRRAYYIARSIGDGGELDREHYAQTFGADLEEEHGATFHALREGGLIDDDGRRTTLTEVGRLLHDRVTLALFPEVALDVVRSRQQRVEERFGIRAH